MVSFLKSRRECKGIKIKEAGNNEGQYHCKEGTIRQDMETSCASEQLLPALDEKKMEDTSRLLPPQGWLHMDVVEREKLEWTTDVSSVSTSLGPKLDKVDIRFSLEGLVIPQYVDVPSHLGLHHHGDEPEVKCPRSYHYHKR